jgi:hypothetical protein
MEVYLSLRVTGGSKEKIVPWVVSYT